MQPGCAAVSTVRSVRVCVRDVRVALRAVGPVSGSGCCADFGSLRRCPDQSQAHPSPVWPSEVRGHPCTVHLSPFPSLPVNVTRAWVWLLPGNGAHEASAQPGATRSESPNTVTVRMERTGVYFRSSERITS